MCMTNLGGIDNRNINVCSSRQLIKIKIGLCLHNLERFGIWKFWFPRKLYFLVVFDIHMNVCLLQVKALKKQTFLEYNVSKF